MTIRLLNKVIHNSLKVIRNVQTSAIVHLILVKMAAHGWMLLEVTSVIVKQNILATSVKHVRTT